MSGEKVVVTLDDFEQRLMVSGLADFRNDLIRDDKPTEDVDELILKVIDAPTQKEKRKDQSNRRYLSEGSRNRCKHTDRVKNESNSQKHKANSPENFPYSFHF